MSQQPKLQFKPSQNQLRANKRSRCRVLKWQAVALWSYDMVNDTCAICRNKLHELCIECQADAYSSNAKECTRAWGACNHTFHWHCIGRWLKTKTTCPMDNIEWEYDKIE